jgi:hypothetical protein
MKALAKRPPDRFATCSEMEATLWSALEVAGWRRPATEAVMSPQWQNPSGSGKGHAFTGTTLPFSAPYNISQETQVAVQGAVLPETMLAVRQIPNSAEGPESLLDRLNWKHYLAAAVLALALGGGAVVAVHSRFPGSPTQPSNAGQNTQHAVQSAPAKAAGSGESTPANGNPGPEPDAKAQEKAKAAEQQQRHDAAMKALDEK